MEDKTSQGVNNVEETQQENSGSPEGSSPSNEKPQEVVELEARKAELEEQVSGLEGTVNSLKEDIVRKRQERKGVDDEQQPVIDKEALLVSFRDELDEKLEARIQPVLKENEILRKAVLKSNEDALKSKKMALDSINARIASSTAAKPANQPPEAEPLVELSDKEAKIAKELGLKNPRYMREVEVL